MTEIGQGGKEEEKVFSKKPQTNYESQQTDGSK